jgi:hypothetical protein
MLTDLLGYSMYKDFIAGLAVPSPAQKWLDLRDGKEFSFTLNGQTVTTKWVGLINTIKDSIIARYVYCKYRNNKETFFSGQSQVKAESENSVVADFSQTMVAIWNDFIKYYGEVPYEFDKYSTYSHYDDLPSAYNFLLASKTISVYENWKFEPKYMINEYGI